MPQSDDQPRKYARPAHGQHSDPLRRADARLGVPRGGVGADRRTPGRGGRGHEGPRAVARGEPRGDRGLRLPGPHRPRARRRLDGRSDRPGGRRPARRVRPPAPRGAGLRGRRQRRASRWSRARPSSSSATTTSCSTRPRSVSWSRRRYRSNAAIIGPKLVEYDHPEVLLEVGLAIDRFGVPHSGIEPGELDQEQHDSVRDVFFVSSTVMLVRADLFAELGGFDDADVPRRRGPRPLLARAHRRRARDGGAGRARAPPREADKVHDTLGGGLAGRGAAQPAPGDAEVGVGLVARVPACRSHSSSRSSRSSRSCSPVGATAPAR